MKKLFVVLGVALLLTGCTVNNENKKGDYVEGTYLGTTEYESYGKKYVVTAAIYVDASGMIKSCFLDSTYVKDEVITTKKTLGKDYGMKEASASVGNIPGGAEWYEQAKVIEDKVVENQGLSWVKWDETNTKLDGVSGVTISASDYIKAINNALDKAKLSNLKIN